MDRLALNHEKQEGRKRHSLLSAAVMAVARDKTGAFRRDSDPVFSKSADQSGNLASEGGRGRPRGSQDPEHWTTSHTDFDPTASSGNRVFDRLIAELVKEHSRVFAELYAMPESIDTECISPSAPREAPPVVELAREATVVLSQQGRADIEQKEDIAGVEEEEDENIALETEITRFSEGALHADSGTSDSADAAMMPVVPTTSAVVHPHYAAMQAGMREKDEEPLRQDSSASMEASSMAASFRSKSIGGKERTSIETSCGADACDALGQRLHVAHCDDSSLGRLILNSWHMLASRGHSKPDFKLKKTYVEDEHQTDKIHGGQSTPAISPSRKTYQSAGGSYEDLVAAVKNGATPRHQKHHLSLIIRPDSSTRIYWDLAGTVLLLYDMLMIPFVTAFDPEADALVAMDWITLGFWTWDMVMSCLTGVLMRGHTNVCMTPRLIFWHYLRGWFLLDVCVVVPDWVFAIMEIRGSDAGDSGGRSRLLRTLRIARSVRLLRLAKLKRIMNAMKDKIESESAFLMIGVVKLVMMLLIVNHFTACIFYALGNASEDGWIDVYDKRRLSLSHRYFISLHWSLTQFTPATMPVHASSEREVVYTVIVLVLGLAYFSSFVSAITASMNQLRAMSEAISNQFWLLRRYLRQRKIPPELRTRILRYLEYSTSNQTLLVPEGRIWLLKRATPQLINELHFETQFSVIKGHPLFEYSTQVSPCIMLSLSDSVLSVADLASDDMFFTSGSESKHMFMLVTGRLSYLKAGDLESDTVQVRGGGWLSEASLFLLNWAHIGSCIATDDSNLVCVNALAFEQAVYNDPAVWRIISAYARKFLQFVNSRGCRHMSDVPECYNDAVDHAYAWLGLDNPYHSRRNMGRFVSTIVKGKTLRTKRQVVPSFR